MSRLNAIAKSLPDATLLSMQLIALDAELRRRICEPDGLNFDEGKQLNAIRAGGTDPRFEQVDALRAKKDAIKDAVQTMDRAALEAFDARTDRGWA